jgi:hypothetical protein
VRVTDLVDEAIAVELDAFLFHFGFQIVDGDNAEFVFFCGGREPFAHFLETLL